MTENHQEDVVVDTGSSSKRHARCTRLFYRRRADKSKVDVIREADPTGRRAAIVESSQRVETSLFYSYESPSRFFKQATRIQRDKLE